MIKKWTTYNKNYENLNEIMKEFQIPEIVARSLINRDIDTVSKVRRFLDGSLDSLYDPYLLKGMGKAVERIREAVSKRQKICVYGDYDVDGITSAAIMIKALRFLGAEAMYYIPRRIEEGYGLNKASIEKLKEQGVAVVVTVDCGIRSIDVVDYASSLEIDVIVTDHHECEDKLPNALSIINPHQPDCGYPFKELAGVGVAFKLVQALVPKSANPDLEREIVEIAAVGTIADVVPIIDENRIIVKNGLANIQNTANQGLKALLEVSGLSGKEINSCNIAFMIAPRINAAGRIAAADRCVELLLTEDKAEAMNIAERLDSDNRERQSIETKILNDALSMINASIDLNSERAIVLGSYGWHAGVIGIVASKLVERFHLPVLLVSIEEDIGKGSARSIPKFNLYEAMVNCSDLFEKFGGHELAAGFSIKPDNIAKLRERMNDEAERVLGKERLLPEILVDYKLSPEDINLDTFNRLKLLEPFGTGNPSPVFVYRGLKVLSAKTVGNESRHLMLNVYDGVNEIRCIGFNLGHFQKMLSISNKIDIICSMENNKWNNIESVQLSVKDIRLTTK